MATRTTKKTVAGSSRFRREERTAKGHSSESRTEGSSDQSRSGENRSTGKDR